MSVVNKCIKLFTGADPETGNPIPFWFSKTLKYREKQCKFKNDIIETWAMLIHDNAQLIAGEGGVQPEIDMSSLKGGNSKNWQIMCVQFITIKPSVSCWEWVGKEQNTPQSELD